MLERRIIRPIEAATKHVWDLIRERELGPGDRIYESRIAKHLGISQGAVREVLHRLAEQGIVEIIPFKGCRVVSLTPDDLDQIVDIRQLLEPRAIRLGRDKVIEEDLKDLHELIDRMDHASDIHVYDDCHFLFHQRLWEISQNRQLVRVLRQLTTSLFAFYEVLRTPEGTTPEHKDATHHILIEALQEEVDPEETVREHIMELKKWVRS